MISRLIFIKSFIFLFIFSFLFIDNLYFDIFNSLRIYYVDIFFLSFFLLFLILFYNTFFVFILNYERYNYFDYIIFLILIIKILKYAFDFSNYANLGELIRYCYILCIFFLFKFILNEYEDIKITIYNSFTVIFLFSIFILLVSYIFYLYDFNNIYIQLWQIKEIQYPYLGKNIVHFDGFLNYYNMQAYIMIPGFFILLASKSFKNIYLSFCLLFFFCLLLFLIKSKILIIVFFVGIFYIFYINYNFLKFQFKYLFLFSILIAFCYYALTHFLFLKKSILIDSSNDYMLYFTSKPIFSFFDYNLYGSLFFKLKLVAFEHFKSYNYFIFDSINYNQFLNTFVNIENTYSLPDSLDPHSELFSFIANYGLIGLISVIMFLSYPFYCLNHYLKKSNTNDFQYLSIIVCSIIFVIESFNADIIHFRFYWILISMMSLNLNKKMN